MPRELRSISESMPTYVAVTKICPIMWSTYAYLEGKQPMSGHLKIWVAFSFLEVNQRNMAVIVEC